MSSQFLITAAGICISLLTILLGDDCFRWAGVESPEMRVHLITFTSVLSTLVGFLYAQYSHAEEIKKEMKRMRLSLLNEMVAMRETIIRKVASFTQVTHYQGGDGLRKVQGMLKDVRSVKNTRIVPRSFNGDLYKFIEKGGKSWNDSIVEAVAAGTRFIDIVSDKSAGYTKEVINKLANHLEVDGSYLPFQQTDKLDSFLNFKILEFYNGDKEVWFGWRISRFGTIDGDCFQSSDKHLIDLFENWFEDLCVSGKKIGQPQGSGPQ